MGKKEESWSSYTCQSVLRLLKVVAFLAQYNKVLKIRFFF